MNAQADGIIPELDYSHYQTRDLAISIGKNSGIMGLQTAAVITGLNIAASVFKGEQIEGDALIESAIKTGADTSIKTVVAGTMEVAIRRGMINQGLEYAYPIVVGDNVWIGAGVQAWGHDWKQRGNRRRHGWICGFNRCGECCGSCCTVRAWPNSGKGVSQRCWLICIYD